MIRLGPLALNGIPRIAVSFKDKTAPSLLIQAKNHGLDIAELRIDHYRRFDPAYVLKEIEKYKKFPVIVTLRLKKEGGNWPLSEEERLRLFAAVLPKADAIDIELSAKSILSKVVMLARKAKKPVIISYHNFDRTPDERKLKKIAEDAKTAGADIVKIAALALKKKDVQTLGAFTIANASKNLVTIAMGENGVVSRVLFPALGSLMTYAHWGNPTAQGQLSYDQTFELLRVLYPDFNREKISIRRSF